jgi:hypothetical protein
MAAYLNKLILFHAIKPSDEERAEDWETFLVETALAELPPEVEKLAPNVWLLPDEHRVSAQLSRIGHQLGIETRCLPFSSPTPWQPLSPSR